MSYLFKVGIDPTNTMWRDERFPAQSVKLDATNPPTPTAYRGSSVLAFASNPNQKVYFLAQLNHDWKMGTNLDAHLHIVLPTAGAGLGAENVKFDLTYSWAYIGYSFPVETPLPVTRDVQNDPADTHIYMDIGHVLASNASGAGDEGVSSMLLCSLTRDTSVANDYADDVYLLEVDFHIQVNSIGSRFEASK